MELDSLLNVADDCFLGNITAAVDDDDEFCWVDDIVGPNADNDEERLLRCLNILIFDSYREGTNILINF